MNCLNKLSRLLKTNLVSSSSSCALCPSFGPSSRSCCGPLEPGPGLCQKKAPTAPSDQRTTPKTPLKTPFASYALCHPLLSFSCLSSFHFPSFLWEERLASLLLLLAAFLPPASKQPSHPSPAPPGDLPEQGWCTTASAQVPLARTRVHGQGNRPSAHFHTPGHRRGLSCDVLFCLRWHGGRPHPQYLSPPGPRRSAPRWHILLVLFLPRRSACGSNGISSARWNPTCWAPQCRGHAWPSSRPSCGASKSTVCLWGHVGGVVGVSGNGVLVSIFSPILYLCPLSTLDDQSRAQAPASHAPALGGDAGEGQADCAAQAGMEVIVASVVISFLHGALISSFSPSLEKCWEMDDPPFFCGCGSWTYSFSYPSLLGITGCFSSSSRDCVCASPMTWLFQAPRSQWSPWRPRAAQGSCLVLPRLLLGAREVLERAFWWSGSSRLGVRGSGTPLIFTLKSLSSRRHPRVLLREAVQQVQDWES